MSKAKLEAARELIKEKQYAEARAILRTIKTDPTAQRWLAKLDEIAPEQRGASVLPLAIALVVLLVVLVIGGALVLINRQTPAAVSATAQVQLPTLAELPSATATTVPTATYTVTPIPTETETPTALPTSTVTPLPSNTPTPRTTNTRTPSRTPARTSTPNFADNWFISTEVSPFDGSERVVASLLANDSAEGWLSDTVPTIHLRCEARQFDVFIHVGTQFAVETGHLDEATVRLRFDQEPAYEARFGQSTTGDSVFIDNPIEFASQLVAHQQLLFGFTPFNATFTYVTFDLRGLADVIEPLVESCNLPPLMSVRAQPTAAGCTGTEFAAALRWFTDVNDLVQQFVAAQNLAIVQSTRDQVNALTRPTCVAQAYGYIQNFFEQLYLGSISSSPATVDQYFNNAMEQLNLFYEEAGRVIPGLTR